MSTTDTGHPSAATQQTMRRERGLVLALAGVQFAHILDFMVMLPLGPMLMDALRISTSQFALLVSVYTLAAACSGVLAAGFVDALERKGLLLALFALFALATLSCALAPDYATLLCTRALAGAFGGVLSAMLQTIIGDAVPFERRGRASGAVMSATSLATVAGVPLALLLATRWGWAAAFAGIAALAVPLWLLAARHVPRLPRHAHSPAGLHPPLAAMRAVLQERNHRRALLFMTLGALSTFTVIPYLTLYLTGNLGLTAQQLPLVYALGGVAGFLTARRVGRLSDDWGKVRTYRVVALLSVLPILLQTHLPPLAPGWVLLVSTLFFTFGQGRAVPAMAITLSAVQPALRGTFMALNATAQQLACGTAALVGGLLVTRDATGALHGYGTAGWLAIALTVATLLLAGKIQLHVRPHTA